MPTCRLHKGHVNMTSAWRREGEGEAVPVHSRLAGPQDQNKDWFDFGSKIPKSVVCGLEVVQ